jgi:hypothetical protein
MFLNNISISDSITVDFPILNPTTTQQYTFPDIPYLREKKVFAIALNTSAFGVDTGLNNIGLSLALGTGAVSKSSFLTLYDHSGNQFIQDIPLQELIANKTFYSATAPDRLVAESIGSKNGLMIFRPRIIQWTKCSIYFPVVPTTTGLCFQFDIFYRKN